MILVKKGGAFMATVSYGLKITSAYHIFDETIKIYRKAVEYITDITLLRFDEISVIDTHEGYTKQQAQRKYMESLIHTTKENPACYERFDKEFYKFPSYLRREAITTAIGIVSSYKTNLQKWEADGKKGRRPHLNRNQNVMPCFYRNNTFMDSEESNIVSLKLYSGRDWVWETFVIRDCDFMYAYNHMKAWKASAPVLTKRNHRYELRISYEMAGSKFPKFKKDKEVETVIGVDLGINTDAVCSVVHKDGTVTGQRFINHPVEKDRMHGLLNTIKKAQQNGNHKTPRLWRLANNYNEAIAVKTAVEIVRFAMESKADVIVFEHLNMKKKKKGNKQKLSLWRKRDIQHRVEALAARNGIRVSYICAVNTSRLAFDGSGKVLRGKDAGFDTYELCKFTTGKVYNCDLSASKNIGARFFIRVLLKSLSAKEELLVLAKVPELNRRTSCCLATLINAYAVLCASKAKPESPAEGNAARQSH